jgi:integrase
MAVKKLRGRWVAEFRTPDGERVRRVSPVQTKRGAEAFELHLRSGMPTSASSTSTPCSPEEEAGPVPTLEAFAREFLECYAVPNNKPSEVVSKETILRVHWLPFFESRRLDEIGARDIERYKAAKLQQGLKAATINNHLAVLRKLMGVAVEWEVIETAPRFRRLKTDPPRFDWLRPDESCRFLAAIAQQYPQWKALFTMALHTGLRRGELFGLHWADLDLHAGAVHVRHSVYRGRLQRPKGGRGRSVPLSNTLAAAMRSHQLNTRLKGALVFPGADGQLSRHQDHVDRPLHGALRLAGLRRIRFHDLRHTFASQLVSAGRSLKEVQELLGHQSIQMTMRYAHLAPDRMREAVLVLDGLAGDDDTGT